MEAAWPSSRRRRAEWCLAVAISPTGPGYTGARGFTHFGWQLTAPMRILRQDGYGSVSRLSREGGLAGATIEDGSIVIRIPVVVLTRMADALLGSRTLSDRYRVADPDEFAARVVGALNRELEETGESAIDHLLEQAIEDAANQGAASVVDS
jgi:hypothetical protein